MKTKVTKGGLYNDIHAVDGGHPEANYLLCNNQSCLTFE
jgi:hypothetical protein